MIFIFSNGLGVRLENPTANKVIHYTCVLVRLKMVLNLLLNISMQLVYLTLEVLTLWIRNLLQVFQTSWFWVGWINFIICFLFHILVVGAFFALMFLIWLELCCSSVCKREGTFEQIIAQRLATLPFHATRFILGDGYDSQLVILFQTLVDILPSSVMTQFERYTANLSDISQEPKL